MNTSCCFAVMVLTLLVWFVYTPQALAHKVIVFAWVEDNMIHTESKFSGGRMVNNGQIRVYDDQGTQLLQGRTDDQGRFAFAVPSKGDLKIVLDAGMGHGNEWVVRADEITAAVTLDGNEIRDAHDAMDASVQAQSVAAPDQLHKTAGAGCLSIKQTEQLMEQVLDRKIAALKTQIDKKNAATWRVQDILGGLGYILGLMGLAAYIRYQKQTK